MSYNRRRTTSPEIVSPLIVLVEKPGAAPFGKLTLARWRAVSFESSDLDGKSETVSPTQKFSSSENFVLMV